jgi:hypothetical protein
MSELTTASAATAKAGDDAGRKPKRKAGKLSAGLSRNLILITVQEVLLGTAAALGSRRSKPKARRYIHSRCDRYLEPARMAREMDRL